MQRMNNDSHCQLRQHVKVKVQTIEGVNDFNKRYVFQRRICEECGEWLGDNFLRFIEK